MVSLVIALVSLAALAGAEKPPISEHAAFSRWLVNEMNWAVLSTISTDKAIKGYPFGNPVSVGDNATGTPYMCVSGLDASIIDLEKDPKMSLTFTEAQGAGQPACDAAGSGDPENPPCSRLVLTGDFKKIDPKEEVVEWQAAAGALKAKHPVMDAWGCFGSGSMSSHAFFLAKIDIKQAWLINMYGGASVIAPKDYYAAPAPKATASTPSAIKLTLDRPEAPAAAAL